MPTHHTQVKRPYQMKTPEKAMPKWKGHIQMKTPYPNKYQMKRL